MVSVNWKLSPFFKACSLQRKQKEMLAMQLEGYDSKFIACSLRYSLSGIRTMMNRAHKQINIEGGASKLLAAALKGGLCLELTSEEFEKCRQLSLSEKQLLVMVSRGLSYGEIAKRLGIKEVTVKARRLQGTTTRLGVGNHIGAALSVSAFVMYDCPDSLGNNSVSLIELNRS